MSRRYVIHIAPVQHLNGKLAPSDVVCHNQPDTSTSPNCFYYGYRYGARPEISRYALREKARNLSDHPYTQREDDNKSTFTTCVETALTLLANTATRARIIAHFKRQRKYIRLYNYTIATLRLNGGIIPEIWVH